MSSRVLVLTKRFCSRSIKNLCAAIELSGYGYKTTQSAIIVNGHRIEIGEEFFYIRMSEGATESSSKLFDKINGKLAEIEAQLKVQSIEKNRLEQERAKEREEAYRVRQLKREEERLDYERKQLELERQNFVDAKKRAVISKAKAMGYSVEERTENGTVKLKLIKRLY